MVAKVQGEEILMSYIVIYKIHVMDVTYISVWKKL